jgi:hypothetical protein
MRFISDIQLKHEYLTHMQELKRAMTCVSFDDYKYFSLTFPENVDNVLIKLFACLICCYCFLLLLMNAILCMVRHNSLKLFLILISHL